MSPSSRSYAAPPIEEALVELRFAQAQPWDPTIPGKLHGRDAIRLRYDAPPMQINVLQAAVQAQQGKPLGVSFQDNFGHVQLKSVDGSSLMRVGPGLLSVHALRPYPGWDVFRPHVEAAVQAYLEVAGASALQRIGIRYINRVPSAPPNLEADAVRFFRCAPRAVAALGIELGSFLHRTEHIYPGGEKLLVTHATVEGPPGHLGIVLDLDVVWEGAETLEMEPFLRRLDDLHARETHAFEALITDEARKNFDAAS